jgi:hypothetical protein
MLDVSLFQVIGDTPPRTLYPFRLSDRASGACAQNGTSGDAPRRYVRAFGD